MSHKSFLPARRGWLKQVSLATVSIATLRGGELLAQATTSKRVEETEAQAAALGYKQDATKVDKAKFSNFQPGSSCSKCNFFKGKAGDVRGPCDLFSGREVEAKGWCSAWVKKA
jgi:hypothetical protein